MLTQRSGYTPNIRTNPLAVEKAKSTVRVRVSTTNRSNAIDGGNLNSTERIPFAQREAIRNGIDPSQIVPGGTNENVGPSGAEDLKTIAPSVSKAGLSWALALLIFGGFVLAKKRKNKNG